ncbi:MAG: type II toxin-antitoxin system RelE/ParE family toxin [Alphaproteobacteria bacterium]|nr:type II toxin-antitoxin system RelE/ParE family toxin [Alphaproteobacteria bacterium]
MKVRLSGRAERDLEEIRDYIARDRPLAASRIVTRVLQSLEHLQHFPLLGRVGLVAETRELLIAGLPYRAVYRVHGDTIVVVAIIHTSRRFPPP